MTNFRKTDEKGTGPLRVALCVSRNKDNRNVPGFRERRRPFLTRKTDAELREDFRAFEAGRIPGEFCRLYVSVNARDAEKVRTNLLVKLITEAGYDPARLNAIAAGVAGKKECAAQRRWLFDFDFDDAAAVSEFAAQAKAAMGEGTVETRFTPHGYAVITERGFDSRELLGRWPGVELKRDDMLCLYWTDDPRAAVRSASDGDSFPAAEMDVGSEDAGAEAYDERESSGELAGSWFDAPSARGAVDFLKGVGPVDGVGPEDADEVAERLFYELDPPRPSLLTARIPGDGVRAYWIGGERGPSGKAFHPEGSDLGRLVEAARTENVASYGALVWDGGRFVPEGKR